MGDKDEKPLYLGHRKRLRERFQKGGAAALADYELLELILFAAFQRKDTKPLAKALVAKFGGYAEVLSADEERLKEVDGIGEAAISALKVVRESALKLSQSRILHRPIMSSWDAVVDYCRAAMAYESKEQFRILFLDKKNVLIADEVQQQGTVDHTPVYPREVIKRALELGATALILTHNHPSGDPTPSRDDIEMTREIADAGKKLGVAIHDHIIVGKNGHASFKGLGLI